MATEGHMTVAYMPRSKLQHTVCLDPASTDEVMQGSKVIRRLAKIVYSMSRAHQSVFHTSGRPKMSYLLLKASQNVLNTPRGRDVLLSAKRAAVYNPGREEAGGHGSFPSASLPPILPRKHVGLQSVSCVSNRKWYITFTTTCLWRLIFLVELKKHCFLRNQDQRN